MKILITGAQGQLGNEIKSLAPEFPDFEFIFTDVQELDISSKEAVLAFTEKNAFDALINCAAYTAVDKAEEEQEKAYLLNEAAVKYLAEACELKQAYMIHISTDYVFGGTGHKPYTENDPVQGGSVYAQSKAAGEAIFLKTAKKGAIVRTSWLYSSHGHNFVKTMLKYGQERESLNVVFDQVGTPTYAADLAKACLLLLQQKAKEESVEIYHYANEGVCSWYDFALAIMEIKGIECKIKPIRTEEYPLPAPRPYYSVLDKKKIKENLNIEIPHWKESLYTCLQKL